MRVCKLQGWLMCPRFVCCKKTLYIPFESKRGIGEYRVLEICRIDKLTVLNRTVFVCYSEISRKISMTSKIRRDIQWNVIQYVQ